MDAPDPEKGYVLRHVRSEGLTYLAKISASAAPGFAE